ncbi:MAG: hypothetical protein NZ602_09545, partial [Thermoguttaceae bacterium]|nr:hypothetical protein [Thermoguttaceae bacterium]MDW8039229.1 hypothetical protein [Thermoguttaceae bacterium]
MKNSPQTAVFPRLFGLLAVVMGKCNSFGQLLVVALVATSGLGSFLGLAWAESAGEVSVFKRQKGQYVSTRLSGEVPTAEMLLVYEGDSVSTSAWKPVGGRIMTRWAGQVRPDNVWPEYPRPTMVRPKWLNLNGLWDYAIRPKQEDRPTQWDGKILVPFCAESALSGVGRAVGPDQRLWYRRTFELPADWAGGRV